jgi:hypothetical protein
VVRVGKDESYGQSNHYDRHHSRRVDRGAGPPPECWLILEGDHEPAEFEMWQNAAGMLVGRKNYEGFAAVWPTMAGDGRWAEMLNP